MKTYKVININEGLGFEGKGLILTVEQALTLFDSLGGTVRGFRVVRA